MEDILKITLDEFFDSFASWVKEIERQNIILYYVHDDIVIITFKYDFQFLCICKHEELREYYKNEHMSEEQVIEAFVNEHFKSKAISTKAVLKYLL